MRFLSNHIFDHERFSATSPSAHNFRYVVHKLFKPLSPSNNGLSVDLFVGLCTIFSVVVLGLSANLTNVSSKAHAVTDNEVMGLVTSILSILIFPAL